jgi:hypothetical protein
MGGCPIARPSGLTSGWDDNDEKLISGIIFSL